MANFGKTLIGGASYDITGGKVLAGGTSYSISEGATRVNGTNYAIGEEATPTYRVTVSGGLLPLATSSHAYVVYNGGQYVSGSFTVPAGSTITVNRRKGAALTATAYSYTRRYILESGNATTQTVAAWTGTTSKAETYTITSDTTITFTASSGGGTGGGEIM